MSGPKVVRVVTREERIEICEKLLAQLDAEVRALKVTAARFDDAEGSELAAAKDRRTMLADLVRQDNFDLAERQLQQEIDFVKAKRNEVVDRATSAAAVARRKLSQQRHSAATLLRELERRAPEAYAELSAELKQIAGQSYASTSAESALAKALMALSSTPSNAKLSDEQITLARSLQGGPVQGSQPSGWQAPPQQDKRIAELQLRLSQIEVLKDATATATFAERLDVLEREVEGPVRNMKLDALVIEVASTVDSLRRLTALMDAAKGTLAELQALGAANLSAEQQALESAVNAGDEASLKRCLDVAIEAMARARAARAASARREAILSGLASLGYQVNEEMSTSWVEDGRVVLRKADADMHGVEIASAPDAQRLQVRAVAFSASLAPASNLAAETNWCGDFGRLQEYLKEHSGELAIERAKRVGEVPLKVVQAPSAVQSHTAGTRTLKSNRT